MTTSTTDIIDQLAGIEPGSHLDQLRARRPQARENAQKSYLALFDPEVQGGVTPQERYAVAAYVAGLHRQRDAAAFYLAGLRKQAQPPIVAVVEAEIAAARAIGPYGRYPDGPLSRENLDGPVHRITATSAATLGPRLSSALEHAHLLVFHPRDSNSASLQRLLDAGWSTTDIVTLSQLVAFLSFQIRVVAGLRTLAATKSLTSGAGSTPSLSDAAALPHR
jgi:CMD domain protein